MKCIWLVSWFPNPTDPSAGDFIERQAYAVAPFINRLDILFVYKDPQIPMGTTQTTVESHANITIHRIAYGNQSSGSILEPFWSMRRYKALQENWLNTYEQQWGTPDILHVHVAMKAGIIAPKFKKKWNVQYLVTEHWTGYYPHAKPNFKSMGFAYSRLNRTILQQAALLLPVSNALGKLMQHQAPGVPFQVIPNVVDTQLFYEREVSVNHSFRFLHFSYLNEQKNPRAIIDACLATWKKGYQFECYLIGAPRKELVAYAHEIGLPERVLHVLPAISYKEVAQWMRKGDALLLFSKWENLPCVVLEALCCGLPVISSDVGGIAEVINTQNGILVAHYEVSNLAAAMEEMLLHTNRYTASSIASDASELFNYYTIGKQLAEAYQKVAANSLS